MEEIIVYSIGLCSASVCARNDMSIEQITNEINKRHPTGLNHGWKFAEGEKFAQGNDNPCLCNTNALTHKHYLFHC